MGGPWCKVRKSTGRLKQGTHNSMVEVKARVDGNGGVHKRERTVLVRLYGIECRCDVLRPPCRYKPCMYSYHEERISKNTDIMSLKILWRPNFLAREWYRGIIDCDAAVYKITKVFFSKGRQKLRTPSEPALVGYEKKPVVIRTVRWKAKLCTQNCTWTCDEKPFAFLTTGNWTSLMRLSQSALIYSDVQYICCYCCCDWQLFLLFVGIFSLTCPVHTFCFRCSIVWETLQVSGLILALTWAFWML